MMGWSGQGSLLSLRMLLALSLGAIAVAVLYVAGEHAAYFWDWGAYWSAYQAAGETLSHSPLAFLQTVLGSIRVSDYNLAPVVPLMPSFVVFGGSRVAYVASICALFVIPAAMLATRLANRAAHVPLCLAAAVTFPIFWSAALRGMPDVVGLIPLAVAAMLIRNTGFLTRASTRQALAIGALLWLTFLMRRWYAFSVLALILVSLIAAAIVLWADARQRGALPDISSIRNALLSWGLAGAALVGLLLLYQTPLVMRVATTDYAVIYSAYQANIVEQLVRYYGWFGPLTLALVTLGAISDAQQRRFDTLFFLVVAMVTIALFARVQAPGVHHVLPVGLMVFPAYAAGICRVWSSLPRLLRLLVPVVLVLNFANVFAPERPGGLATLRNVVQPTRYPPLHLVNYVEYQRLLADLAGVGPAQRLAVFASSPALSDSLLAALDPSLTPRLLSTSHVDLRDRFSWLSLMADYVLIGEPTPLHLPPSGQRVISLPAEEIGSGTGIGRSFEQVGGGYSLDDGVVARLFRRREPIPPAQALRFAEQLYKFYPDWRAADARVGPMLASSTLQADEGARVVSWRAGAEITMRAGERGETSLTFPSGAPWGAVSLQVTARGTGAGSCERVASLEVRLASGGAEDRRLLADGESAQFTLPPVPGSATLMVAASATSVCAEAVVRFDFGT